MVETFFNRLKNEFKYQIPFLLGIPAIVWQVLFFVIPLFFVVYISFMPSVSVDVGFTLRNYFDLFDTTYITVILRSFILALANTLLCMICAYPIAYFLAVVVQKFKLFWLFLLLLPFWTNFLLHVYSWFFILERGGVLNTLLLKVGLIKEPLMMLNSVSAVMIVMFYCYLPFMILPLYSILDKLDVSLLEASADLGAGALQTFFRVTLPITLPGLQLGFFLVFVPSFGEFAIPALVGGDKITFVGSLISFLFLEGDNKPLASAYTVISVICIILIAWVFYRLSTWVIRSD